MEGEYAIGLTEIICSGIAVLGVIVSAIFSWAISRSAAKNEIKKLRFTWQREDSVANTQRLSDMIELVTKFTLRNGDPDIYDEMCAKVKALRAIETGEMRLRLGALETELTSPKPTKEKIESALQAVIDCKADAAGQIQK